MRDAHNQYLDRHAEPEAALAAQLPGPYAHVVAIPAAGEGAELHAALESIPRVPGQPVLAIVVVNERPDSAEWIRTGNRQTLRTIRERFGAGRPLAQSATVYERDGGALLVVDRTSSGSQLPVGQGVGLARKIGADIALSLWSAESLKSRWIHCTDADVRLPPDYFARSTAAASGFSALVYPYRHVAAPDSALTAAALEYEISLRYYERGLEYAGSPFSYPTIGSTLAVSCDAYAQVRGFPKRLAAEDFYLLNKLAKIAPVHGLTGVPIELSSRASERTPFGTGRAIAAIAARGSARGRGLYHPDVFAYLGAWEQTLGALSDQPGQPTGGLAALIAAHTSAWANVEPGQLLEAVERIGADRATTTAGKKPATRRRQLREAFDAARTLKLVHTLRDGTPGLESLPLSVALRTARFLPPGTHRAGTRSAFPANPDIADLEHIARSLGRPD